LLIEAASGRYLSRTLKANLNRLAFFCAPAWAHTCGCKSRRELITTNEMKRNCMRATECGKKAWSINREPMNNNRIEGAAKQGGRP
jgi:hypothetical protein